MTDLVERYVHRVGRYLPPKERAEIEAELRSQIQDQLDDRSAESPTPEEIASVLREFGHPYQMAASYNRDRYLVGPDLYPYLMMVLRHVWVVVPTVVIFLDIFGALVAARQGMWLELILETLFAVLQATLSFSAVLVLLFAFIERVKAELEKEEEPFNPLELSPVDDPSVVDRFEEAAGTAVSAFFSLVVIYWLYAGGLTLRFNLNDPGDLTPVPMSWLVLLLVSVISQLVLHLFMLPRNRWSVGLWLMVMLLEVFGVICLYFAVLAPAFDRLVTDNPALAGAFGSAAETIAIGLALLTLVSKGIKLVRLWSYRNTGAPPFSTRTAE